MISAVSWSVSPAKGNVNIINAGIAVFFRDNGFSREDGLRFQACVEGVFSYCVGNIRAQGKSDVIRVDLSWADRELRAEVKHAGPGGEWDAFLDKESPMPIRRTSFDSMGLFTAREMADELIFRSQYDLATGQGFKEYEILYKLDREMTGGSGDV